MDKRRVYQVAKERKLSSDALISVLKGMGLDVKSHMSVVTDEMLTAIDSKLEAERKSSIAEVKRQTEKEKSRREAEKEQSKAEAPAVEVTARPEPARIEVRAETGTIHCFSRQRKHSRRCWRSSG